MSLLGTLGGIVGGVAGFLTGGVGGAVTGFHAGENLGGGGSNLPALPGGGGPGTGSIFGNQTMPFGLPTVGQVTGTGWGTPAQGQGPPRGYHLNKHALAPSKRHGAVPARSVYVRNRKMNPLNPRAITRALKREKRARKLLARLHVFKHTTSTSRRSGHRAGCGCVVCRRK